MEKISSNKKSSLEQFERIVDQYQDRLFRFVYMRIGNRETSEDLLQDVFLALYRKIRTGHEIRDVEHYLLQSVNNVCVDYYRKNRLTIVSIEEVENVANESDREIHEEFLRIRKLLDDLPIEQAETLRLKCYDNLSFRQISELHQVPEPTVKSRYRYAIKHIQEKIKR